MNWAFGFCVATVLCWVALAALAVRFPPPRPIWPTLFWFAVAGTLWSAGELGTSFIATDAATHWRWLIVLYTGVLTNPPLWWSLTLRLAAHHGRRPAWATPLVEYTPLAIGAMSWLALVTNPWHAAFIHPVWDGRNDYRMLWYLQAISGYACLIGASAVILWLRSKTPRTSSARVQLDILAVAGIAPIIVNFLYTSRIWNLDFDPTILAFGFGLMLAFAGIVRSQLFSISGLTLDHLIRHESDGVVIVASDGGLVSANPAATRILDCELTPGADIIGLLAERLHVPSADHLFSKLVERVQPEDGHVFPARERGRWIRVRSTKLPARWPGRAGVGLRLRDESKLHEATERAAHQAASIEAILSSIRDGLFVADANGRLLYANAQFWKMWELPRIMPAGVDEAKLIEALLDRVEDRDDFGRVVESTSASVDVSLKSGRIITVATVPLVRGERSIGRVWTFRDITERRDIEERMRESQKLESLGVLAGGIAHDFNNILVGILGNVDLAMSRLDERSDAHRHLVGAKSAADRAAELVQELLAYAGRGQLPSVNLDLSKLVRETRELVLSAISKKAELSIDLAPDVYVEGDTVQLRQIIMNLITNASDALGEEAGKIEITTGTRRIGAKFLKDALPREHAREGEFAFLEISDTGCGMDRETLGRIFEPFFSTKFTGRGLGLAAALGIVRSHGGFIKVTSVPGEGTTFLLLLPIAAAPAKDEPVGHDAPAVSPVPGTVLVVDDEEAVRNVARSALELEGYRVLVAADGHEGVRRFRENAAEVEAIVLDMTMPRMDGAEALFAIRQLSRDVPVILSSGYSEQDTMARCVGLSSVTFIQKPYTPSALVTKIREASAMIAASPTRE